MSQNVGEIDLGLDINQNEFNRQLNGIAGSAQRSATSIFGGLGKTIGKVLGVAAIVGFGKSCLELGSDLSEVQNVVDVTFGSMADQVNKFASTAIEQFGLSETAAKQYTGTMGAMLKSCGLTTKQALEMSKTITGLSADMASFYNLDNEVAFEKIRSGISGETEPLKQLGINMSVANLEAYRMSQGITKAYSKMSQQEQTLLRYNYLLSVTKDAQGDFARTSDSWANQVRILTEQFNALKAAIGGGLIAAFTPIIKGLNFVIAKLRVAAGYFKAFMELIFGKQSSGGGGGGVAQTASDVGKIGDAAGDASNSIGGIGDAATDANNKAGKAADGAGKKAAKAAKKAKGALASFDELNQLNIADDSDSGSGGGGGAGKGGSGGGGGSGLENMGGAVDVDLGSVEEGATKLDGLFSGLVDELNRLKDLFATGFKMGLGDDFDKRIADIKNSISGIKDSLIDIFTDSKVVESAKKLLDAIALNAGKIAGSFVSIGATIAQNLLGGLNKYLDQNKDFIKKRLVGIMDAATEIANLAGNFAVAFADIFSVFGGETAQQCTANIIAIFENAFLGSLELAAKFGRDILKCITEPIIDNKDQFKTAIEGLLSVFESFSGTISDLVTNTFSKALEVYDTYFAPGFEKIKNGISGLISSILDNFNSYVLPMLQEWGKEFSAFYSAYLQPLVDKLLEVGGKIFNMLSDLWQNILSPMAQWLISTLTPAVSSALDIIWQAVVKVAEFLATSLNDILTALEGVIDFLDGVFTGDWSKCWEGIKEMVSGVSSLLYDLTIGALVKIVEWLAGSFISAWNGAVEGIKNFFSPLANWFVSSVWTPLKTHCAQSWEQIKTGAGICWQNIQTAWNAAGSWWEQNVATPFKQHLSKSWEEIKTGAGVCWQNVQTAWSTSKTWWEQNVSTPFKTHINKSWSEIKTGAGVCWGNVKSAWSSAKSWWQQNVSDPIGQKMASAWDKIGQKGASAWTKIKDGCRSAVNGIIDHINGLIRKLNGIGFDMPKELGGGHIGFSIPTIPKLARGGVVDQPTLSMIGEAGKEAVVPLQNNTEWTGQVAGLLANALAPLIGGGNSGVDTNRDIVLNIDGVELVRAFLPTLIKEANRQGVTIGG